jgi:hypothetical protein
VQQLVLALVQLLALVLELQLALAPVLLVQGPELGSSKRSAERWCRLPAGYWF